MVQMFFSEVFANQIAFLFDLLGFWLVKTGS